MSAARAKQAAAASVRSRLFAFALSGNARCARVRAPPTTNMSRNGPANSWAETIGEVFPLTPLSRLVHSFTRSFHHDRGAAPAGVAAPGQLAGLGVARDGLYASEIEVALLPALHRPATLLERVERARIDPGLGLDDAPLEVKARQLDRILGLQVEVDDVQDRLEDRGADAVRPGRPQGDLRPPVLVQHDGRVHHARHARAAVVAVQTQWIQVLLAEHVVQVDAGARDDHAVRRAV